MFMHVGLGWAVLCLLVKFIGLGTIMKAHKTLPKQIGFFFKQILI